MGNVISKQDIEALFKKQVWNEIIEGAIKESFVLQYFTELPRMTSSQIEIPVLSSLPHAYWQDSDTSFKKLTNMAWSNKRIRPAELAVIVPISENYLEDSERDIWAEVRPRLIEAFGKKIDQAIIMGTDKPGAFRMSIVDSAINAGATVTSTGDLYKDIDKAMTYVEMSDYEPNVVMGSRALKSEFRRLVDSTGQPIQNTEISSLPRLFMDNGAWDKNKAMMILGDFKQAVYAIRQEVTFKIITEGIISDPVTGNILYNLPQQDMIAIRAVMRIGWEVPNPINALNDDNSTRFPFAVVLPNPAETKLDLTFTVKDSETVPAPIQDAIVMCAGVEKKTDAAGQATFKVNGNTTYNYAVKSQGKQANMSKVEVQTSDTAVNVTLLGE